MRVRWRVISTPAPSIPLARRVAAAFADVKRALGAGTPARCALVSRDIGRRAGLPHTHANAEFRLRRPPRAIARLARRASPHVGRAPGAGK
ncbi:MAG TPA: hypothetical protein VN754_10010, partial [Candidatus Binataceae bacterium]|nr:hypothetical protein [Candidatus Binataceae bacterium]